MMFVYMHKIKLCKSQMVTIHSNMNQWLGITAILLILNGLHTIAAYTQLTMELGKQPQS